MTQALFTVRSSNVPLDAGRRRCSVRRQAISDPQEVIAWLPSTSGVWPSTSARSATSRSQLKGLEEEVVVLRRRLQDAPKRVRTLEERILETKGQLAQAVSQNERLSATLREAREHIAALREEVEKLTMPPSAYGTFLGANDDGTVDIFTAGRKMRVVGAPRGRGRRASQRGQEVVLNESLNVVLARGADVAGRGRRSSRSCSRTAPRADRRPRRRGARLRARRATLHRREAARRRPPADGRPLRPAASSASRGPRSRSSCSKRSPTSPTTTSAASTTRSSRSRTRSSCRTCYARPVPRARAAAAEGHPALRPAGLRQDAHRQGGRELAREARRARRPATPTARSYFLNIKGPELLNKYVGETERQIRLIFQRAREKSRGGLPRHRVLRRDGLAVPHPRHRHLAPTSRARSCRSCSPRSTASRALKNVIVIGASNREDLIDPAILRPGRLDVKIKIERPDEDEREADLRASTSRPTCRSPTTRPSTPTATPATAVDEMIDAAVDAHVRDRRRRTGSSRSRTRTATRRSCTSRTSRRAP